MKRTVILGGACACALALAAPALAGQVTLTASDNFATVVVKEGNYQNPDFDPTIYNGPMSKGQSITSRNPNSAHLCWKRENNPGHPETGLEANWNCISNPSESPEQGELH
jgi:hypothetical protein